MWTGGRFSPRGTDLSSRPPRQPGPHRPDDGPRLEQRSRLPSAFRTAKVGRIGSHPTSAGNLDPHRPRDAHARPGGRPGPRRPAASARRPRRSPTPSPTSGPRPPTGAGAGRPGNARTRRGRSPAAPTRPARGSRPSAAGASPAQSQAESIPGSSRPPRIRPALTAVSIPASGKRPNTTPAPAPARGRQRGGGGGGGGASRASAGTSARRTFRMIASMTASASSRLWQSLLSESSMRTPSRSPPRVDSTTSAR